MSETTTADLVVEDTSEGTESGYEEHGGITQTVLSPEERQYLERAISGNARGRASTVSPNAWVIEDSNTGNALGRMMTAIATTNPQGFQGVSAAVATLTDGGSEVNNVLFCYVEPGFERARSNLERQRTWLIEGTNQTLQALDSPHRL